MTAVSSTHSSPASSSASVSGLMATSSSPSVSSSSVQMSRDPFWDKREFVCGWGAAVINICTTFPINKVMFRQMVHGVRATRAVDQLKKEGLANLYKGLLPPLMSKTASVSLMFGSYSSYRHFLDRNQEACPWILSSKMTRLSVAAFLSGSTEAILCPFERVQMLLQSRDFSSQYKNTFKAMKKMTNFGVKEYYRGMTAILLRNGPSNIMFFAVKERSNNFNPSDNYWLDLLEHFVTGAVLGAFISTTFYPLNVVRTKMQTVAPGSPHLSIATAAKMVYQERQGSLRKIYYGVSINCTRALLSWGIINVSYEVLRSLLYEKNELETLRRKSPLQTQFFPSAPSLPSLPSLPSSPSSSSSSSPSQSSLTSGNLSNLMPPQPSLVSHDQQHSHHHPS